MENLFTILLKLFRRENILTTTLIICAVLSLIGLPQQIGITSEQIIIALLALLTIDTLIERLGYLDKIERQITQINDKMHAPANLDNVLKSRTTMPPFTDWLNPGTEIWLASRDSAGLIRNYGKEIEQATKSGCKFRFLISNPDNKNLMSVMDLGKHFQVGTETVTQVRGTLQYLEQISKKAPNKIVIRVTDYALTNTFLIVNPALEKSAMILEFYGYSISASNRIHMHISKDRDLRKYNYFLEEYTKIWEDSHKWVGSKLDERTG